MAKSSDRHKVLTQLCPSICLPSVLQSEWRSGGRGRTNDFFPAWGFVRRNGWVRERAPHRGNVVKLHRILAELNHHFAGAPRTVALVLRNLVLRPWPAGISRNRNGEGPVSDSICVTEEWSVSRPRRCRPTPSHLPPEDRVEEVTSLFQACVQRLVVET